MPSLEAAALCAQEVLKRVYVCPCGTASQVSASFAQAVLGG